VTGDSIWQGGVAIRPRSPIETKMRQCQMLEDMMADIASSSSDIEEQRQEKEVRGAEEAKY